MLEFVEYKLLLIFFAPINKAQPPPIVSIGGWSITVPNHNILQYVTGIGFMAKATSKELLGQLLYLFSEKLLNYHQMAKAGCNIMRVFPFLQ